MPTRSAARSTLAATALATLAATALAVLPATAAGARAAAPGGSVRAAVVCDNAPAPFVKPLLNALLPAPDGRGLQVSGRLTGLVPGHRYQLASGASWGPVGIGAAAADGTLTVGSRYLPQVASAATLPGLLHPGDPLRVTLTDRSSTGPGTDLAAGPLAADPACGTLVAGLAHHEQVPTWRGAGQGTPCVLVQQGDGNLVYVVERTGRPLWSAGTAGHPGARAVMQSDGNLVVYAATGAALFQTGTSGHPGASLTVQSDGNLVVYDPSGAGAPLWQAGTAGRA